MSTGKKCDVVTGIFTERGHAVRAIHDLEASGFTQSEISVLMSEALGSQFKLEENSKAPEGAAAGAVGGGLLGALIAGLTAVGTIATGGGLLVAGPIVAALAGAGLGAGAGGTIGALVGYGMSEYEARLFAGELEDGNALLAVECLTDTRRRLAERILEEAGATSTSVV
jgi:hypothetical protein